MTLVVDAGLLVTMANRRDPLMPIVDRNLREESGGLILPAAVSAEVDYLVRQPLGRAAGRAFLCELADGKFRVECLHAHEYAFILQYDEQYANLDVGLADLSVVALAYRFRTRRVLTFGERHFRVLRPLDGGSFVLLPRDDA